ncbi:MAG: amino acid adenylation domain-containing protein [Ruminococcaceae bacterium]|nr:amino acid adenylation domain-containing protein [Oscillospiraceae bacterium]
MQNTPKEIIVVQGWGYGGQGFLNPKNRGFLGKSLAIPSFLRYNIYIIISFIYNPVLCKGGFMTYHILSYMEEAVRKYPDRIALSDAHFRMTYREMWNYVTSFGGFLCSKLKQTRCAVAVCLRHDVYDVLSFFSIAYSGNFYVPVDLSLPGERVKQMLAAACPLAVLVRDGDDIPRGAAEVIPVPAEIPSSAVSDDTSPWKGGKDTDPLYLIFTSGSTGVPKGVLVSHRSVVDMVEAFHTVFSFRENAVFGNQAPFDFDVSVKDIYLSLKVGGRLEILEKKLFSFPKLLIERLNEREVDTVIWAVPALKIMAELDAFSTDHPRHLRDIMFSGEVMPPKALAYWREKLPHARYVNLYGPTEITCNCTYYVVSGETPDSLPIGTAFPNCSVFLLCGDSPAQDGETGEICVTGSCLALGYYREPQLTDAAFVRNPLVRGYTELMYRTGDMGRMQDGLIYYMGRADTQIKHMGHRIELAEIELCANSIEGVDVSACVYDSEERRICLFYKGEADRGSVLRYLRGRLPKYMIPGAVERCAAFPVTRTGKIDRKALLAAFLAKARGKN